MFSGLGRPERSGGQIGKVLKNIDSLSKSSGSVETQGKTPEPTPNNFHGMLTRSSLLSQSSVEALEGSTSSMYASRGPRSSLTALAQSRDSPDFSSAVAVDFRYKELERRNSKLVCENQQLREHIAVLSGALHEATHMLDEHRETIDQYEEFIRGLASRMLLDRHRMS